MAVGLILFGILMMAFAMVAAKRMSALIFGFRAQSFFLFLLTFILAFRENSTQLYFITTMLFAIKVVLVPNFLRRVARRIKVNEDLGLSANPTVSILAAVLLSYMAYLFTGKILSFHGEFENSAFFVSLSVTMIGIFLMMARMKALAQIIGLLVMENGMFLAAASVSGGMPFIVEIAIFFDILLVVIILGVFVFKINKLFTHIDVDKLTELKG